MKFFEFYGEEDYEIYMLNLATIKSYQLTHIPENTSGPTLLVTTMDGMEYYAYDNIQNIINELNKDDD